ncbi:RNA recognition motif domain-containing protein [Ditylenchus destructor]|nr:RNA recognition motif domain-containing protein [Ditylenchus destructor]
MLDSGRALRLLYSYFRPLPIHFNKSSINLCHFSAIGSNFSIKSSVNCEETRNFCTSAILKYYSAYSKEKLLSAANRRYCAQISRQNFSSISGRYTFDESRTLLVASLSKDTTEAALCEYFSKNYDVTNCIIARDKMTGNSRRFGFVELLTAEQAELASKDRPFIDDKQVTVKMKGCKVLEEKYRIFVGGLLKETSGETLHEHFSKFGNIFECSIVRSDDNLSKGFGFVTYTSQESIDRVLNSQPHRIDNKVVDVQHATPRRRELTLFVVNLSPKTTDESLRDHFSKYGELTQCNVKIDRQTGHSRRFGYVAFESQEEVNRALDDQHMVDGVELKLDYPSCNLVVKSLPQEISEESLKKSLLDFFSFYGRVRKCEFIKNSLGTTTAFISLSGRDEVADALADRPHCIEGKMLCTYQMGQLFSIYVGGLPDNATENSLYATFLKFGQLIHWEVMRDPNTRRSRNYGFVSFSSAEEVNRVIDSQPFVINGTKVDIQRKMDRTKTMKNKYYR